MRVIALLRAYRLDTPHPPFVSSGVVLYVFVVVVVEDDDDDDDSPPRHRIVSASR